MGKKTKVLLALSIAFVLVVVATTAARCTLVHRDDSRGQNVPVEEIQEEGGASALPGDAEKTPSDEADVSALLKGNAWTAADGKATIAFKDGRFVESDGTSDSLTTFDIESVARQAGQTTILAEFDNADGTTNSGMIFVREDDGGVLSVVSDSFQIAKSYTQGAVNANPVIIEGVNAEFLELLRGTTDKLQASISDYAKANAPTATKADWSRELVVSYADNTVSANFTLDDPASTVVTVEYDRAADSFAVMG